ncbi:hypothetical protein HPG69_019817 [Diceros bicornis minor]|uniref:Uncharacterized protein n=1 Tax=Diceros bicornis minor TaxID=77932 RepID=A0A7J7EQS1_DICBM|nr:hypothetical protein HPG69_019817 [Diceros bicornis minor]
MASVDLLQDCEGFTWKGHEQLSPRTGPLPSHSGFLPHVLVQSLPSLPSAPSRSTANGATSRGFGLFHYQRKSPVFARCTLHTRDSGAMERPLS